MRFLDLATRYLRQTFAGALCMDKEAMAAVGEVAVALQGVLQRVQVWAPRWSSFAPISLGVVASALRRRLRRVRAGGSREGRAGSASAVGGREQDQARGAHPAGVRRWAPRLWGELRAGSWPPRCCRGGRVAERGWPGRALAPSLLDCRAPGLVREFHVFV